MSLAARIKQWRRREGYRVGSYRMADFGLRTAEYRATVRAVLDDHTVALLIPIDEVSPLEARSQGLSGCWSDGTVSTEVEVRLQGLNAPGSPSAAQCVRWHRLEKMLPKGSTVLLRTDGAELQPGGEWAGAIWANPDGGGLPVNIEILLPTALLEI